jgi:hypothetical protein
VSKHDRDVATAGVILALALGWLWLSTSLPMRGDVIESPGIFPGLVSVVLLVLGIAYAVRSLLRGGRLRLGAVARGAAPLVAARARRPLILGILFPAAYVFVGIPLIGFYVSSAIFMAAMFYAYVPRWRRWVFLPLAAGITLALYLIFSRLFQSPIW